MSRLVVASLWGGGHAFALPELTVCVLKLPSTADGGMQIGLLKIYILGLNVANIFKIFQHLFAGSQFNPASSHLGSSAVPLPYRQRRTLVGFMLHLWPLCQRWCSAGNSNPAAPMTFSMWPSQDSWINPRWDFCARWHKPLCLRPQPSCDLWPFRCVAIAAEAWSRASHQGFFAQVCIFILVVRVAVTSAAH